MNPLAPRLPSRATKPRSTGLTMVIDGGIPLRMFADIISSTPELIDFVKFGWGTAVVTGGLQQKIDVLREHGIGFYLGGTLFEKYVMQERFDDYKRFCVELGCEHVEVSNGTVTMSNAEKASYIRKLAGDFTVVSEVGFKDPDRSEQLPPSKWVEYINEDLAAGATMVMKSSGLFGPVQATSTLSFQAFQNGFEFQHYGYASAISYVMVIAAAIGITLLFKVVKVRRLETA